MSRLIAAHDHRNTAGNVDTVPPTVPGSLAASNVGVTTAAIAWTASTDTTGVDHYNVYDATPPPSGGTTVPTLLGTVAPSGAGTLAYRAGAKGNDGTASITLTDCAIAVPGSAAVGDVAIVTLEANTGANTIAGTPSTGNWALASGPDRASTNNITTWQYVTKLIAADLGSTPTWTLSGANRFTGVMDVFSGADLPGTPVSLNQAGSNTSLTDAVVTTTKANSWIYEVWVARSATGTPCALTLPSSPAYTADQTCASNNGTTNHTIKTGHFAATTVGAYGGNTGASSPAANPAMYYATEIPVSGGLNMNLSGLTAGQVNVIWVTAVDSSPAANESDPAVVTITTTGATDITPPTVPGQPIADTNTPTTNTFHWPPSSDDDSGVDHYIVLRNAADVAHPTASSYTDTGLTANTAYTYTVESVDAAGNISDPSPSLVMTTDPGTDTTPPSTVTGLNATSISQTQIGMSWTAATDNSGTIASYKIYSGNGAPGSTPTASTLLKTVGNVTAATIAGLTPSRVYAFAVTAVDPAGNESVAKSGTIRPQTSDPVNGSTGIYYGINAVANFSKFPNDGLPLAQRNAANGWKTVNGQSWVDTSGNATGVGITRCYYTGALPATFDASHTTGGSGTNVNKRVNQCWKGGATFQAAMGGALDVQFCTWINSIPSGWDVFSTWYHEPANNFNTTDMTPAQYKATYLRLAALLQGNSMPSGQAAKHAGAPAVSLNSNVTVRNALCITVPRGASSNHWDLVKDCIPNCAQMDPNFCIVLDAYQNPPPAVNAALAGGGVNSLYPTPDQVFGFYFSNIHSQYGFNTTGHGYGIGEWMAPPRDNDNANHDGQTNAVNTYLTYLETQAPDQPVFIQMWENPHDVELGVGGFEQHAFPGARQAMVSHALGQFARV